MIDNVMTNLTNYFLVASPLLKDPIYSGSVIYITDHDEEVGAVGVIINRPIGKTIDKIFQDLKVNSSNNHVNPLLFWGGPLCSDNGYVLHETPHMGNHMFELTNNKNVLFEMLQSNGQNHLFVSLGYCGLSVVELEHGIKDGLWMVVPAQHNIIFDVDPIDRYEESLHLLGIQRSNQLLFNLNPSTIE